MADKTNLPAPIPAERNALMVLDDKQVAIKIDREGFLTRVRHTIRLEYGPHLYAACKPGQEKPDTKVAIYQPGYMRYVQALGGQLTCPPAMRDPVTGETRANPIIETYEGSGLIRRVTATGVCAVRNPQTGEWVASVQTVTFDCEHVLRQKLLNMSAERDDAVRVVSKDDLDDMRAAGELKGWSVIPLAPPFSYIVANMRNPVVREAWSDFMNLAQTARQRTCSKAERLAADHNPVVRRAWMFGELKLTASGLPYADIPIVTWVEHRGKQAIEDFINSLARDGAADGVSQVIVGEAVEDDTLEPDEDLDPEGARTKAKEKDAPAPAPKAIEEKVVVPDPALPPVVAAPEKEKVVVREEEEPAPAPAARPTVVDDKVLTETMRQMARPAPGLSVPEKEALAAAGDPAVASTKERIAKIEARLPVREVSAAREVCGLGLSLDHIVDIPLLRTYQRELSRILSSLTE